MNVRPVATVTLSLLVVALGAACLPAAAADRDGAFAASHPRREQVNERLARQNRRIHKEVAEGDLTRAQARKLHKSDREIRREERIMAAQNGGHITKAQQRVLNQQENAVSKEIGK